MEELAYADPSVAWAAVNSNGAALALSRLDPAAIEDLVNPAMEFFGIGLPPTGIATPTAAGGFRGDGRWPVVSGCLDADAFLLHCVVSSGAHASDGTITGARYLVVAKYTYYRPGRVVLCRLVPS